MRVDDSGAMRKTEEIVARIREAAALAAKAASEAVIASTVARTPTVQQEYDLLMVGEEGVASAMPRAGGSSADSDGRKRLEKDESTYLENVVPSPGNQAMEQGTESSRFMFGNIALLNNSTVYRYHNFSTNESTPLQWVTKGPYFSNWEAGSSRMVIPVSSTVSGRFYPLRPDEIRPVKQMFKSVKGFEMFNPLILDTVFTSTMESVLSSFGPGSVVQAS